MNEIYVTVQGWLGSDVTLRQAGEQPVARFRLASTPRRFNPRTNEWSDGATAWFGVSAWRGLAAHCADSLRRGDPVVVHGRLTMSTWISSDKVEVTSMELEAITVGHDLSRGTGSFTKTVRQPRDDEAATTTPAGEEVAA